MKRETGDKTRTARWKTTPSERTESSGEWDEARERKKQREARHASAREKAAHGQQERTEHPETPNQPAWGTGELGATVRADENSATQPAFTTGEDIAGNGKEAYVTQEEFSQLLEFVPHLGLAPEMVSENKALQERLAALERRVEEMTQRFKNNRNSGPG